MKSQIEADLQGDAREQHAHCSCLPACLPACAWDTAPVGACLPACAWVRLRVCVGRAARASIKKLSTREEGDAFYLANPDLVQGAVHFNIPSKHNYRKVRGTRLPCLPVL